MPSNEEWQDWLSEIKKEALKEGISQNTIDFNCKMYRICEIS